MTKIKAILVDDEISNLKGLERKLHTLFPQIEIHGSFNEPEDAIAHIKNKPPDLMFLDVEMPRINGFELLQKVPNLNFEVIFVTAYSDYAIEAFKQSAIDYVLKPIDNQDLIAAVEKATTVLESKKDSAANKKLIHLLTSSINKNNKIIVPTVSGISFLSQKDVIRLEGFKGYTKLFLKDHKTVTSSYSIGKYQKQLEGKDFYMCHRSHLINIKFISQFLNEGYVILEGNHKVPVSKAKRNHFLSIGLGL